MGGIKEKGELSNEFNHPVENEIKQERLELGFQSLDFCDQALDHELIGNQEDGLAKKLSEMTVEGLNGGDEGSELVLAIGKEGGFDKGGNFGGGIGGENDHGGLGGFRDGDELGGELCENENRVGVHDLEGFINDEAKLKERKSEKLGGEEGNEGDFKEIKEGGEDNERSKWSEIENEGGDRESEGIKNEGMKERNPKKRCVVEGNEGDLKEMKERDSANEGSKWSEIENEGGDRDLEGIKDEAEIEERNLEKRYVEDGNEGAFKEIKEGHKDEGSKWSEIGNEGGDCDLGIEDETAIEERNPENRCVVEGNEGVLKETKEGDKDKDGSECSEIGNKGVDRDLGGIKDETAIEERNFENRSVVEENEGDFTEIKEGDKDKEGNKWSEIGNEDGNRDTKDEAEIEERNTKKRSAVEENEGGSEIKNERSDLHLKGIKDEVNIELRDPEKHSLVEENEGDFKEMKHGVDDKEGSHWGESEDIEESYILEIMKKRADKGKAVIEDYEDGWSETWDDVIEDSEDGWGENSDAGAVRGEANQERQWFDNYENERDTYDKGPHWYGDTEKDSGDSNDGNFGRRHRPIRPDAEDCSFYMRTGTCRFAWNCKFNHPLKRNEQAARDTFQQMEEIYDKPGQTECKYHLSPGGCKHGKACRYSHGKGKAAVTPNLELNYIGLPIRVGEKECSFYMKTGSCKYGEKCRFHHPEPTAVGGGDTTSPMIYPPTLFAPENEEWNGYQVFLNSSDNLWKIRLQV